MNKYTFYTTALVIVVFVGITLGLMFGVPKYNVQRTKIAIESAQNIGKAEMAKAQQNRMIQIEEAKANLESQKLNSLAEKERAKGMAQEIENGKLTTKYIQYLWVRNIDKMEGDKIYIATEAGLPLLEARDGRLTNN